MVEKLTDLGTILGLGALTIGDETVRGNSSRKATAESNEGIDEID